MRPAAAVAASPAADNAEKRPKVRFLNCISAAAKVDNAVTLMEAVVPQQEKLIMS